MILLWHLGLGDALVCQGLVRNLAKRHDHLCLPCYGHNIVSLRHMLDDVKNVKFMVISNPQEMIDLQSREDVIRIGMYSGEEWDIFNWDMEMYRQVGVHFSERWSGFKVPEPLHVSPMSSLMPPFCFLHHDPERLFGITKYTAPEGCLTVLPTGFQSILDYVPHIIQAREVHCIDSAFLCLVDSLPSNNTQKLFFHKYARPNGLQPSLRRSWEILK